MRPLFTTLGLLTQVDTNPVVPESPLAAIIWLGSVIVAGLLWALRTLWGALQAERQAREALIDSYATQQKEQLERSLQVTIEATKQIQESEDTVSEAMRAVEAASVMIHQISGRGLPAEQITEIAYHLRALRELRERQEARMTTRGET